MCGHGSHGDPNSFSNVDKILQRHLHFDWTIGFETKTIDGSVTIDAEALVDGVDELVCDNR
jgi:leukotriene-A4 hydrolase